MKFSTPMEKLYIKFCKFLLNVNCKASNTACLMELGRYPLLVSGLTQMFKYWLKISQKAENTLTKEAYCLSKNLESSGIQSWATGMKQTLKLLSMDKVWTAEPNHSNSENLIARFKEKLKLTETMKDNKDKQHKNKLRTYRQIKSDMNFENYLEDIKNPQYRSAMTKLRISAHILHIETGRYTNTTLSSRTCPVCKQGEIEDEEHFLLRCTGYQNERKELFNKLNLYSGSSMDNLIKILKIKDNNKLVEISKFIQQGFKIREHHLNKNIPAAS